jgi:hypothetical protein
MKMFRKVRMFKVLVLCLCASALIALAGAASASANTVVLQPCSNGAFSPWGGPTDFAQWALETRCPSELTFAPIPGKTLGASQPGFYFPPTGTEHGTFTAVGFDLMGGDGSDTGLIQGIKACHVNQTQCGPLVAPAGDDVTTPEHHQMTLANGQIPAGSDYLYVLGECPTAPETACAASRALIVKNLSITLDDRDAPTIDWSTTASSDATVDDDGNEIIPSTGTPIFRDDWNTGTHEIRVRATDAGVGVKVVDYEMHRDGLASGAVFREPGTGCGGSIYITPTIPSLCTLAVTSVHAIPLNSANIWGIGQGLNHGTVHATDAAGNISPPLHFDFKLDSVKPIVSHLEATPDSASVWRASTRIGLHWVNDVEQLETATQSGIERARFKATSDIEGLSGDVFGEPGTAIDSIPLINLPGPGRWNVTVSTIDVANNLSLPVSVPVWVDPTVPDKPVIDPLPLVSGAQLTAGTNVNWSKPANVASIPSGICNYAVAVDQSAHVDPDHLVAGSTQLEKLPPVLPNGLNYAHVRAISCAGVKSEIADIQFEVDSQAPSAVASTPGPGGWYSAKFPFVARLSGNAEPGAMISAAIDGAQDAWSNASEVPVDMPDGEHTIALKAKDLAGNQAMQLLAAKSDSSKPTIGFEPFDPAQPALVRATATDAHSGVYEASMQYRPLGTSEWHSLGDVVRPAGGSSSLVDLNAHFPDSGLPAGLYELQLKAIDLAGNDSSTRAFADGAPAVVKLPLRVAPSLTAGFAAAVKSKRRDSVRVNYGKSATLTGTLADANGNPIVDGKMQILETVGGGADKLLKEFTSGPQGNYSYAIAAGPSRLLTVRFAGDEKHAPASATAKFLTRAKITLRVGRAKTSKGWQLKFAGQVFASGAAIPAGGKSVRLQFHTRRGWDEFPVLATDRNGRFKYARNFSATGRRINYRFRAIVPWSDGWVYETGVSATESTMLP